MVAVPSTSIAGGLSWQKEFEFNKIRNNAGNKNFVYVIMLCFD
jgi:hypothetical protein